MDSATALRRMANDLILIADTVDVHGVETRAARARRDAAADVASDTDDATGAGAAAGAADDAASAGAGTGTSAVAGIGIPPPAATGAAWTRYNKDTSINEEKLGAFLMAALSPDIETILGVGPTNRACLERGGYETTHQVFGAFMTCMGSGHTSQETCDRFAQLLKSLGITSSRNNIVRAVAEKVNSFIPGAYNEEELR